MIENIVHQIWVGDSQKATWNMMNSWKRYCDKYGWEYKLWRENDLEEIPMKNREIYKYYKERNNYQGMSDVARIEILNRYGGIYSDCDFYNWGNYCSCRIWCSIGFCCITSSKVKAYFAVTPSMFPIITTRSILGKGVCLLSN